MRPVIVVIAFAALLAGCKVGPNYSRPKVLAPPQYRGAQTPPTEPSFGDAKWFDVFQDEQLRALIDEAIKANYDIRIAAQRVLQAEGQLAATRSSLFPSLAPGPPPDATASHRRSRRRPVASARRSGNWTSLGSCAVPPRRPEPTCWRWKKTRKR